MAGGTQVTQTTTEPWLEQQQYLQRGFGLAEDLYQSGQFSPAAYGQPGTMGPGVSDINTVAPGLAGFTERQTEPMGKLYDYALGDRPLAMQSAAEQAMLGGGPGSGAPGFIPYAQAAMGSGLLSSDWGGGPTGYAGVLPFEGDQYAQMLRGDVDYEGGPYGAMADVYRQPVSYTHLTLPTIYSV